MGEQSPTVFIVDDDPSMREALVSLLASDGLSGRTFASAQDFLTYHRPDVPSCLLLDVQLPGLSGLDLQQELAKADVKIPIIFITGHGDIPMSVRAIKAGALEFLTKPFNNRSICWTAIQQGIARDRRARQQRLGVPRTILKRLSARARAKSSAETGRGGCPNRVYGADSRGDRNGQGAHRSALLSYQLPA